jgi:DNA-binding transcriptional MerR regulator
MSATAERTLSIADAARETGLTPDTLRYYEREQLMLEPITRSSSTHRRYTDSDLGWIRLLTRLRGTGMPIRDVRRYAELARAGEGNEEERLALLRAHRDQVVQRLEETRRHLEAIDAKIGHYEDRLADQLRGDARQAA